MLFEVRDIFKEGTDKHIKIIQDGEKFGIINLNDNSNIVPCEYDNIFLYGVNLFVLYKKGKIGAVRIENNETVMIAKCEYDTLETFGHDLLFTHDEGTRYYNSEMKIIRNFREVIKDSSFFYCKDDKYQYIIYGELGEVVYKKNYITDGESCFCYCGKTDNGYVFYDASYSTYIYPTENGYSFYNGLFNYPIIISGNNVANISESENGIGLIDSYGNTIIENEYDKMKVELKVTAFKDNEAIEKTIPFSKNDFEKGELYDIGDWF